VASQENRKSGVEKEAGGVKQYLRNVSEEKVMKIEQRNSRRASTRVSALRFNSALRKVKRRRFSAAAARSPSALLARC
jgi:hypothetical protein